MTDFAETPDLSIDQHIATIRLRRPGHANRLGPQDLAALREHLDRVNADDNVRVLRFLSGGKYFCSGYDISSLASDSAPSSLYFGQTMDLIEAARPVTIAAIQGGVYGGGTDLCLACDFRIGTPQADMFMPATRLGLHFYAGGMSRYVTRLGLDQAKRLFLTAQKLQADEMLRIGFLTEMVPDDMLPSRLDALSQQIAGMAPIPLFGVKAHLNRIARGEIDLAAIEEAVLRSERSRDLAEGAKAWKEKRPPNFTGC
ncbi:enoyl-CoA hydratase/isomerase family protein [Achromobacter insolitus]|uniref:enoyl-CoA hydratase/isomerase family protein n=1 Tax=Achromobacter insolitus TaxID=217204 RepID=UPI0007C333C5|nr:enoyl-CoA hydratase/isomerase family protein [Achromobacter insolitus]MDH3065941.1 enoyl-CoA hydratase/isomerase family protein [Achromobacter insolitus]OAD13718.1 3-hydroxybutyryl-CoA dehydratase [Achromobacter insolitus]WKK16293.1 enoyl-CoA hydratase/isomerase family protein [Achromobacter insolitus]CAB3950268.1 Crotonyl-CoA hydratase [Achromobacter insolitus]